MKFFQLFLFFSPISPKKSAPDKKRKPIYKIFSETTVGMRLNIPETIRGDRLYLTSHTFIVMVAVAPS